jgi:dolichol-phosphate mannosyltransferase
MGFLSKVTLHIIDTIYGLDICSFNKANKVSVSVVLPTYNESKNIVNLVKEIIIVIDKKYQFEILVVDDNSPDETFKIVENEFKDDDRIIPILRITDRGFAKSIREGIDRAKYGQIIVMDTDFTHDPKIIPKLLHVAEVYDLVSASRFAPGGSMQDKFHYYSSLSYNWLLRIILGTQIQDNLGGYFTAKKEHLTILPLDEIFYGYGEYYFRLLHFMQHQNRSIIEIPAIYADRAEGESKSKFINMIFVYLYSAVKLKLTMHKLK